MPRYDMTGPMGAGAFTGRGVGHCAQRSFGAMGYGRGVARGAGRGMGFRRGPGFGPAYYVGPDLSEKDLLEDEKTYLEEQLDAIKKTLSKLDSE